ncbi:MAG: isochorismatase family protein [Streptococcaceae bacterium]|nr:isochorismatase family protein [Streptococcaceae bacterium]MCL2681658.1 isochorismatase family protein [Streptococcaceae bacterium]
MILSDGKAKEIVKFGPSAFAQSDYPLDQELKETGITNLYVTGVSTNNGVIKTANDAKSMKFETYIVDDASSAVSQSTHDKAITQFGKSISTNELLNQ